MTYLPKYIGNDEYKIQIDSMGIHNISIEYLYGWVSILGSDENFGHSVYWISKRHKTISFRRKSKNKMAISQSLADNKKMSTTKSAHNGDITIVCYYLNHFQQNVRGFPKLYNT